MTLGRTQGHQEDLRKSKNTQNTSQLDMQKSRETARKKTIEDMMKTEKEKEAQAQEDIEEEIIAQEMIVTVIDQQEEEDTETENIVQKAAMKEGGMLAMGSEKSAQRPLVMGGLL